MSHATLELRHRHGRAFIAELKYDLPRPSIVESICALSNTMVGLYHAAWWLTPFKV
jgi:hypothetical protein